MVQLLYEESYAGKQFTTDDGFYIGSSDLSRFVAAETDLAFNGGIHVLSGWYLC